MLWMNVICVRLPMVGARSWMGDETEEINNGRTPRMIDVARDSGAGPVRSAESPAANQRGGVQIADREREIRRRAPSERLVARPERHAPGVSFSTARPPGSPLAMMARISTRIYTSPPLSRRAFGLPMLPDPSLSSPPRRP